MKFSVQGIKTLFIKKDGVEFDAHRLSAMDFDALNSTFHV